MPRKMLICAKLMLMLIFRFTFWMEINQVRSSVGGCLRKGLVIENVLLSLLNFIISQSMK